MPRPEQEEKNSGDSESSDKPETCHREQCPTCGAILSSSQPDIRDEIIHTIAHLERNNGKASTRAIAIRVMLSEPQTWRYLHQLEEEGRIYRIGKKGGWKRAA